MRGDAAARAQVKAKSADRQRGGVGRAGKLHEIDLVHGNVQFGKGGLKDGLVVLDPQEAASKDVAVDHVDSILLNGAGG